jgi:hypothetical protein
LNLCSSSLKGLYVQTRGNDSIQHSKL